MRRRTIPKTNMPVSVLCLGTMTFGTPVAEKQARLLVDTALDVGVTFFDTANIYEGYARSAGSAGGLGEAILGRSLAGHDDAVVATKVGNAVGPDSTDEGLSEAHVRRECERSLERLRRERIDLYYAHRPDPDTPVAEMVATFAALIAAGAVRCWGLSNFDATQTQAVLAACDAAGAPRPVAQQPAFSLLNRRIEHDLLPLCHREEIGVVPYRVLEGGVLTGKYRTVVPPPPGSRGDEKAAWVPRLGDTDTEGQVDEMRQQADRDGTDLLTHVLRGTADVDGITSVVLGATRAEQVHSAARALG